jgi:hypothetical protein
LLDWIRKRCSADDADVATRIKLVFQRVHMRPDIADPEGSVLSYCCAIHKELEISGVSQILNEVAGAKLVVKHAMLKLEPPVLNQAAQDAYDLWSAAQKNDFSEATCAWQVVARQTAAAWPSSGNKRSREDKKIEDRRDAARDKTSEEPVRKKHAKKSVLPRRSSTRTALEQIQALLPKLRTQPPWSAMGVETRATL